MSSRDTFKQTMRRITALAAALLTGCGSEEAADAFGGLQPQVVTAWTSAGAAVLDFDRTPIAGDLVHYSFLLAVGDTPHARLRVHRVVRERAPWQSRPKAPATMLLHGDFSTFSTNFAPALTGGAAPEGQGLAVYLAEQGVDVWGIDRRWTTATSEGTDRSDFGGMGFAGAIQDTRTALAFARWIRGITGAGWGRVILGGFSRGGHLAYAYAAEESQRPPGQRHVDGLAPIDIYAAIGPDDDALRQGACARRDEERTQLEAGAVDSDNGLFALMGELALTAPADPSPLLEGADNRDALLLFTAQTSLFYTPTPVYHLTGATFADGAPSALRYSPEAAIAGWFAGAPPYQALAEVADSDALWCGEGPLPVDAPLEEIAVPIFYLGAAGGFGEHGVHSATLTASADVTTHVVRRLDASLEAEDFGHADLLHAEDAPALAWQPLADWILDH